MASRDLSYLYNSPEPPKPYQWSEGAQEPYRPLYLVYERGDGTSTRYEANEYQAWAFRGDPYDMLSGEFESYDGNGCAYFLAR